MLKVLRFHSRRRQKLQSSSREEMRAGLCAGSSDAFSSFGNGAIPEYCSIKRIFTGKAQPADAIVDNTTGAAGTPKISLWEPKPKK